MAWRHNARNGDSQPDGAHNVEVPNAGMYNMIGTVQAILQAITTAARPPPSRPRDELADVVDRLGAWTLNFQRLNKSHHCR